MQCILKKVHGPELILPLCLGNFYSSLSCQLLSSTYPYFEVFLPINAFRSLLVYDQTFAFEIFMEPTTTIPFALRCKFFHPGSKRFVLIRLPFPPRRIPAQTDETSGAAPAQPKAVFDIDRGLAPCLGR